MISPHWVIALISQMGNRSPDGRVPCVLTVDMSLSDKTLKTFHRQDYRLPSVLLRHRHYILLQADKQKAIRPPFIVPQYMWHVHKCSINTFCMNGTQYLPQGSVSMPTYILLFWTARERLCLIISVLSMI